MELAKEIIEVLVAALTVLGILWRALDGMIAKKVEAQLAKAMEGVNKATKDEMDGIRRQIGENHQDQMRRTDERFDQLTNRIDRLINGG